MLGPIERHLLARPPKDRDLTVLHPSEFTKPSWCPREGWFILAGHLPEVADHPSLQMHSVFSEGHGIHKKWQRWADEVGILLEAEYPIVWRPYRVKGHADGLLLIHDEHLVLEIKSMSLGTLRKYGFPIEGGLSQSFRKITRPFNDHIRQAMFYAWVLRHEYPDLHRILFLYECKEDQSAREFVVEFNMDYIEVALEKLHELFPEDDGVLVDKPPRCTNGEGCICEKYES